MANQQLNNKLTIYDTKDTKYDASTRDYKMSNAMLASMHRDRATTQNLMVGEMLDYLPDTWIPSKVMFSKMMGVMCISHKTNPNIYYYYQHKNYINVADGLEMEPVEDYNCLMSEVLGQQPSRNVSGVIGLEIILTKDFFDFFYPNGLSLEKYVLFMCTLFYAVGGTMDVYSHDRTKMDVDTISLFQTRFAEMIKVEDIVSRIGNYSSTYALFLKQKRVHVPEIVPVVEDYKEPYIPNFEQEIIESKLQEQPARVHGVYLEAKMIGNFICEDCQCLGIFQEIELAFKTKIENGVVYAKGNYEIVSDDYNKAIQMYLTVIGHKFHDKSVVISRIPYLDYSHKRYIEDGQEYVEHKNGVKIQTAYNNETYEQYRAIGETQNELQDKLIRAIDIYYKNNPIRQYLKYENKGSGVSIVKFIVEFHIDPSSLSALCPMIRVYKNKIYWWTSHELSKAGLKLKLLWAATDIGFRYTAVREANNKYHAYRILDYDVKAIESKFFCPLTHKLLLDPVVTLSGKSYDKMGLEEYIRIYGKDPETGQDIEVSSLRTNITLRELVSMMYLGYQDSDLVQAKVRKKN